MLIRKLPIVLSLSIFVIAHLSACSTVTNSSKQEQTKPIAPPVPKPTMASSSTTVQKKKKSEQSSQNKQKKKIRRKTVRRPKKDKQVRRSSRYDENTCDDC